MIQTILFDAFGTLFSLKLPTQDLQRIVGAQSGELLRLWREKQLSRTWLLQAMGRYENFNEVSKKTLEQSIVELGLKDTMSIRKVLLPIYQDPNVYPDVIPGLEQIKSMGCQTYILSNGTPEMLQNGIQKAGLHQVLDGFISVDEIRQFKPSRDVYYYALEKTGISLSHTLFVSSNQWDIAGALSAGLNAIWLNRDQKPFEDFGFEPKAIISSIQKLPGLVKSEFQQS